jgi:hypothetical protein
MGPRAGLVNDDDVDYDNDDDELTTESLFRTKEQKKETRHLKSNLKDNQKHYPNQAGEFLRC